MKDYVESNENILLHLNEERIQHLSQGVDVDFQLIAKPMQSRSKATTICEMFYSIRGNVLYHSFVKITVLKLKTERICDLYWNVVKLCKNDERRQKAQDCCVLYLLVVTISSSSSVTS